MVNYNSKYLDIAGTSVNWLDNDHPLWYEHNLKENLDLLEKHNWIDKVISYQINKNGYRCEEFDNEPCILFLGCSHTLGIGLDLPSLWNFIVAERLKLKYINISQSGASNDTTYRLGSYWIPKLNPKIVFLLQPANTRTEIITSENKIYFLLVNQPETDIIYKKQWHHYHQDWVLNDTNILLNQEKNRAALELICLKNNIKFVSMYVDEFENLDLARDLIHYGRQSNINFARKALDRIFT